MKNEWIVIYVLWNIGSISKHLNTCAVEFPRKLNKHENNLKGLGFKDILPVDT